MKPPPEGQERRLIDREQLTIEENAALTYRLRFHGTATREDILGLKPEEFTEGEPMRQALLNFIFRLSGEYPTHLAEFIRSLERQHGNALDTLAFFKFLSPEKTPRDGDTAPPSFEKVLRGAFPPEELDLAQKVLHEPTLELIPIAEGDDNQTFAALVTAMDENKTMPGQINTYVNEKVYEKPEIGKHLRIIGYRARLIEGVSEMPVADGDDVELNLVERVRTIKQARQARSPLLRGVDRVRYAWLMMHSLRGKKPIDRSLWTILDDDEAMSTSQVPVASWDDGLPGFVWDRPGVPARNARFRASVGRDVLFT